MACCCLLMRRGADVNARDNDGRCRLPVLEPSSFHLAQCCNLKCCCRFVLQLLLLGGQWDDSAAEAVAMAVQCGADVAACDSLGNTALAAAISAASLSSSPQSDARCVRWHSLEAACVRLLRDGGNSSIPSHSHVQIQREVDAALEQLPLALTCIRLGWRALALELIMHEVPLHPAKEMLLALCRCVQ